MWRQLTAISALAAHGGLPALTLQFARGQGPARRLCRTGVEVGTGRVRAVDATGTSGRLRRIVGGGKRATVRFGRRVVRRLWPRGSAGVADSKKVGQLLSLIDSGLFDAEFYGAQVGREFATDLAAARHLVKVGLRSEASIHPLVTTACFSAKQLALYKAGDFSGLVEALDSTEALSRPWSPLFEPKRAVQEHWERSGSGIDVPLTPRQIIRELTPDAVLPTVANFGLDGISWSEARNGALASARDNWARRPLLRARTTKVWDEVKEAEWLEEVSSLPLPSTAGPLVSIIMPVWNRPEKIVEAIRSVQAQTLDRWELVVIDDGSTDNTLSVVKTEASRDPRIVPIAADHAGVSEARNRGLAAARGLYVAFLDSDNSWRPNYLDVMVRAMHHQSLDAAYSALRMHANDSAAGATLYRAFKGGLSHLLCLNHIDLNVLMVKTDLAKQAGGFDREIRRWVDHDFAIRVARLNEPVLLPFIGCDYDHDDSQDRITTTESDNWQFAVLDKAWIDWEQVRAQLNDRVEGRTSIVIPTLDDYVMTAACVRSIIENLEPGDDIEVIVVDNGSKLKTSLNLKLTLLGYDDLTVRVLRLPRNMNFATGSNYGFANSTGSRVLFLNNDTIVRRGWYSPLIAALEGEGVAGVQPLLVYPDDLIQACGTVFPVKNGLPVHILQGQPKEDAMKVADVRFSAVTAAALLMRADEVAKLRGFDALYANGQEDVDLCLRAADAGYGRFRVAVDSVIEHHESKTPGRGARVRLNREIFFRRWSGRLPGPEREIYEAVGQRVAHVLASPPPYSFPVPTVVASDSSVEHFDREGVRLRWSIKNPAHPGPRGDVWGDTHFIEALASALRREGQDVVTFRHGTHRAPSTAFDDVNLVIRGLDRVHAQPGKVNVLWVISHPELVTVDEIQEYDLVYAASFGWAARMSKLAGVSVRPLLQATDPGRFRAPASPEVDRTIAFVGQARHSEPRAVVMDALALGAEVKVWGPRWEQHVSDSMVMGDYFPNEELSAFYSGTALMLNDHWSDMAEQGFISNRLFDIVAAGGRVVSDWVEGIDELFGGLVRTYRSSSELKELLDLERIESNFPTGDEALEVSSRVRIDHSFDKRARTLIEDVEKLWREGVK